VTKLSNSALTAFWECPTLYYDEYVLGIKKPHGYFDFGHRFHALLMNHYCPDCPLPDTILNEQDENECQAMFAAYQAFYPSEDFEVVDCEKRFELPVGNHIYIGRSDMLVRGKTDGKLRLFETKTESRGSKRNLPKAWVARTQASLYLWAGTQVYHEPIDSIILNVCTKGSEKGRVGPTFRRDTLQRTDQQVQQALKDFIYVADQIDCLGTEGPFPRNTNSCLSENGWECDMYGNCHFGIPLDESAGFVQVEPYAYLEL
jgi:PD-(D/E)XK nuclease superfamily